MHARAAARQWELAIVPVKIVAVDAFYRETPADVQRWVGLGAQAVHATGDIPLLGQLLGGQLTEGLQRIVQQTFQKKLP
jgi:hypothetical protein